MQAGGRLQTDTNTGIGYKRNTCKVQTYNLV